MQPRQMIQRLMNNISTVIVGKQEVIEYALIALLCRGHVLIEDVPGVGKTTLASALAKSLDCTFRRIQFTPDLMPSDVTGYTLVNFKTGETEYREGSVMSQVVLADEINRTSPKTQSALLEVMEEQQVTVDGVTHPVPPLPSSTGRRRARCSPGATTSCRRTCSTWRCKCLRTASCSAPKHA